jgi:hypothetical protein
MPRALERIGENAQISGRRQLPDAARPVQFGGTGSCRHRHDRRRADDARLDLDRGRRPTRRHQHLERRQHHPDRSRRRGRRGGNLSVGTGATFTGALTQAGGTAVTVAGGTLTLTNTGALAIGYRIFQGAEDDAGYIRIELEGGRREVISGSARRPPASPAATNSR